MTSRNHHRIAAFLPGVWLAIVLLVFLVWHPLGRPLYQQILPGLFQLMMRGEFPWAVWVMLVPKAVLLALAWLPWAALGWLLLWALDWPTRLGGSLALPERTSGDGLDSDWRVVSLLDRLRLRSWTPMETLTLSPLLGAAVTSTPLVLLGMGFLLSRWTVLAVFILCGAALFGIGRFRRTRSHEHCDERQEVFTAEPDLVPHWMVVLAWVWIGIISAWTFFHALVYPVDYWDALIYYIHYAELTHTQGGFPVMVHLQVGLGLGANYPHLYAVLQAAQAFLFGNWTDAYGQMMMPLAGLGSTLLLYSLVLRLYRRRDVAVFSALAFRLMPYAVTYSVWCSDYALVMFGSVALLATLRPFLVPMGSGTPVAPGPQPPSVSPPILGGENRASLKLAGGHGYVIALVLPVLICAAFPQLNYLGWIVLGPLLAAVILKSRDIAKPGWVPVALLLAAGILWAAPWYIRNQLVTGNPVYAFFPEIFGGKHIDLDVLASCQREWLANGDGLAQVGGTWLERVANTPLFFSHFWWKWAPVFLGLLVPGLFLGWRNPSWRLYLVALVYLLLVLFYAYVVSGLYLYHAIAVFPLAAFFGARVLATVRDRAAARTVAAVMLVAGLLPGIAFAALGPKARSAGLSLLANAGAPPESFYSLVNPGDAVIWRTVNRMLEDDAGLLTHENRYHVFRRDIRVVHLDDWDLLPFYDRPWPEVRAELERRGLYYYLQIPNEKNHAITLRLGVAGNLAAAYELIYEAYDGRGDDGEPFGPRRLYRLRF